MALGWNEAKEVLIAAHLPDVKFKEHTSSSSVDALPVSTLVLELRRCLWGTRYVKEYTDFLKMIEYPCDNQQQTVAIGLQHPEIGYGRLMVAIRGKRTRPDNKVKNIKRHIEDTLIADGVDHMPTWLYEMCEEIHYINLKGCGELW